MKRRTKVTPKIRDGWIKKGLGQGHGAHYKSFLRVRDVPSPGSAWRIPGARDGNVVQEHNLLSALELRCFLLLRFIPSVRHIYDQFALLPVERCVVIAEAAEIRYPRYPQSGTDIVMTTDLVVELWDGSQCPFYIKPSSQLDPSDPGNRRTLEKLLLESLVWADRGMSLLVLTERNIDVNVADNLLRFFPPTIQPESAFLDEQVPEFASQFMLHWRPERQLIEMLELTEIALALSDVNAYKLFSKAVWAHALPIDLSMGLILHDRCVPLVKDAREWVRTFGGRDLPIDKVVKAIAPRKAGASGNE